MRRVQLSGDLYHRQVPDGAVAICRPSRWANPFPTAVCGRTNALTLYAGWLSGDPGAVRIARALGCRLRLAGPDLLTAARYELAGRDLACWCPPRAACHGDLLIAALTGRTPTMDPTTPNLGSWQAQGHTTDTADLVVDADALLVEADTILTALRTTTADPRGPVLVTARYEYGNGTWRIIVDGDPVDRIRLSLNDATFVATYLTEHYADGHTVVAVETDLNSVTLYGPPVDEHDVDPIAAIDAAIIEMTGDRGERPPASDEWADWDQAEIQAVRRQLADEYAEPPDQGTPRPGPQQVAAALEVFGAVEIAPGHWRGQTAAGDRIDIRMPGVEQDHDRHADDGDGW